MHFTPRKPLRSFKNVVFAILAIFVASNFVDSPFTRVLAPVSAMGIEAAAAVSIDDYVPSDVPSSGDANLDLIITRAGWARRGLWRCLRRRPSSLPASRFLPVTRR